MKHVLYRRLRAVWSKARERAKNTERERERERKRERERFKRPRSALISTEKLLYYVNDYLTVIYSLIFLNVCKQCEYMYIILYKIFKCTNRSYMQRFLRRKKK